MKKNFLILLISVCFLGIMYFLPYLMGFYFPSGVDFASYYMEYIQYGTKAKIFETVSIWYEPGYFMALYSIDLFTRNFNLSFLLLEISMIVAYFFGFYLFLGSWTQLSFRKKIIISLLFSISLPQYLIFLHSIRKQFFDGVFYLLFLGILPRCKNYKNQIVLGILFATIFFTHRGVSFYLIVFLGVVLLHRDKLHKKYFGIILLSLIIGILINISYLTPFVQIQSKLLVDTMNSLWDGILSIFEFNSNSIIRLPDAQGEVRGFDMFGFIRKGDPFINYFFGCSIFFIIILSSLWKSKKHVLFHYLIVLNLFIFSGAILSGRLAHLANIFVFLFFSGMFLRKSILSIMLIFFIILTSTQTFFIENFRRRHFGVIDEYMQDFYKKVPKEKAFIISAGDNLFIRYSGYPSAGNFFRTTLSSSYADYNRNGHLDIKLTQFQTVFPLFGYKYVVLPEMLRDYDIYVVMGLYYSGFIKTQQTKQGVIFNAPIEKLFQSSPFFDEVLITGNKDYRNRYLGAKYPIEHVYRLREDAPRVYVPDNDIIFESNKIINNLSRIGN